MIRTYLRNKITGKVIKQDDVETVTEKLCDICQAVVKKINRRVFFDVFVKLYGGNYEFKSEEVCYSCLYSIEKHIENRKGSKLEEIKE